MGSDQEKVESTEQEKKDQRNEGDLLFLKLETVSREVGVEHWENEVRPIAEGLRKFFKFPKTHFNW